MEKKRSSNSNSKLNIAIIHPDLGIGGAERLIVDAAVELASHGHNVHIFTASHDQNRCFEETRAAKPEHRIQLGFCLNNQFAYNATEKFRIGRTYISSYCIWRLPATTYIFYRFHAVCAYLRCIFVALCVLFMWPSFDVILADQVSIVVPLLKLKKETKVVFYCHFPDLLLAQHTTFLRRIYRKPIDFIEELTTGMADMILVNSRFTASTFAKTFKHLHARGIKPAVLYPAVNVNQFDESRSYKLNFLSINRFERKKNIDLAVSAFAMLHTLEENVHHSSNFSDAELTIAGGYDSRLRENVEYLEELKSLAEKKGVVGRVNFVTSCSTAERNSLLSQCLCVIYTPTDEHFGIVPLEAMAAHKPVIACNSGGPMETVKNGETGFLCDPTPKDFAQAMAKLIQDPEMAKRMGKQARQHVDESFSTMIFGQRLNQFLLDVARTKRD